MAKFAKVNSQVKAQAIAELTYTVFSWVQHSVGSAFTYQPFANRTVTYTFEDRCK